MGVMGLRETARPMDQRELEPVSPQELQPGKFLLIKSILVCVKRNFLKWRNWIGGDQEEFWMECVVFLALEVLLRSSEHCTMGWKV